ncbi:MFS general substrate transporter [Irpex rosettiformis]|uniref:MFS general substrate transporter n=1 Tax=Irpex rosettiformis TaxID=378272 RepID=A0ACB8U748_9APHY|nr:MFS general substrate transporter [Irpex rosettiformis]
MHPGRHSQADLHLVPSMSPTDMNTCESMPNKFRDKTEKSDGLDDLQMERAVPDFQHKQLTGSTEENRLVRKLDMRIIPTLSIIYLFAFLDRSNLGNARLQGFPQDVLGGDPTGNLFDWTNTAFYIAYIIFQVPATIVSKLCPPRIWLGCAAIGWATASTLLSTSFNIAGAMTCRVFLGIFEAGFAPGMPLYFSLWYTRDEIGFRLAQWTCSSAVAGAFGGLIAFGIQEARVSIANWRLLFIVEGIPTVLLGLLVMRLLPNRPEETSFLDEAERKLQLERMNRGMRADFGRTLTKRHILDGFLDWRVYAGGVVYMGSNCALSALSAFLPTILRTFGFSNAQAQLMTVPPYMVCAVVMCTCSYVSDKIQSRGLFIVCTTATCGVGYALLLTVADNNHVRYFATFLITTGTYTTNGLMIAWYAHNLGSETKKATGTPIYMAIGQCGSILGTHLFPVTEGPRYIKGFAVSCSILFLASIVALVLTVSYRLENARRDRRYGKIEDRHATVDVRGLADKTPEFRYVP